ncbi:MAG: hypothetical protein J6Y78_11045 [Paludibacteraceae bacterium]|nr:hypothetical protein [Paludibacteraceae bacterium]
MVELMDELEDLGKLLAQNLTTKGVTSSYTEGLTTLANKILTVPSGGGSCDWLEFNKASYNILTSGTLTLSVQSNYEPLANATITLTGTDNSTQTATTDSNGVATFTVTGVVGNTVTYTASYDGATTTCIVNYISYLFYDDCTVDHTSQYDTIFRFGSSSNTTTLSYDSTNQNYSYVGSGGDAFSGRVIPNIRGLDDIKISCKVKLGTTSAYNQLFIGMADNLAQTGSYSFEFFRIRGDNHCDYARNSTGAVVWENTNASTFNGNWHTIELTRQDNTVTGKVYNADGDLIITHSETTNSYTNPYFLIGLNTRYTTDMKNIAEIKVESL